ncbi:MAG: D-glycero-alpha-D-manno-heptose-7-phosphate kinase [Desulfobacteraceae bacterium Eth-SRB1]|nr:MAG: D-glycero-alpha-D-manno-heptose-7-phosphate kinase [Desulfobacteraceae bacterium Eth-SRB1]
MIISRTPFRISFFGGGTDYPVYYQENGGAVLATCINRYCYINVRQLPPFFEHNHRIVYSKIETVNKIDQIQHPSVRECFKYMNIQKGIEIHHDGDLPARSGLGSSSSFTVGLLNALFALKDGLVSKDNLAEAAIHVEQEMIRENVGSQDQTMAAFGGLNIVRFNSQQGKHLQIQPLCLNSKRLEEFQNHLMLFFTGIVRIASDVAGEQIKKTPKRKHELAKMHSMVDKAADILSNGGDIKDFGLLLHESWKVKRSLTDKISNSTIDEIYDKARNAGAIGGKILGAGGGGFILFFVEPERQAQVKEALGLLHVPFKFEHEGSRIIYYKPESGEI